MSTVINTCKQYTNMSDEDRQMLINEATKELEKYFDSLFPGWKTDPNMEDTPLRYTKALVNDICSSLYSAKPKITSFDNVDKYSGIVLQSNIPVKSLCAHHLQNIDGIAHVAYIPSLNGKIIGLSKLNRIVDYCSRRPQVQENLTQQIHDYVNEVCENNDGVAVLIKAKHNCVSHRGIKQNSDMSTSVLTGAFMDSDRVRDEFYHLVEMSNK